MTIDAFPSVDDRTWYSEGTATAFLVDAPITLGHSQLKVTVEETQPEEDAFEIAAGHVAKCIRIFRTVFSVLDLTAWTTLARYTNTSGSYVKTLVLKASANEPPGQYKIHLVPYFDSHSDATARLHGAMLNLSSDRAGGLLNWVGQRERLVDYDMRDERENEVVRRRVTSFQLPQLAAELRGSNVSLPGR